MSAASKPTYDLDYRPESYWDAPDDPVSQIHGQWRREQIRSAVQEGEADEIPPPIFGDALSKPLREFTGGIHPGLMGGEYLPTYDPGEVEIARCCLKSTTGDVISLRAIRKEGLIHYRWRDEYEDEPNRPNPYYLITKDRSTQPLTLRELVELLQNTTCPDYQNPEANLVQMFRDDQTEWATLEEAATFARFGSLLAGRGRQGCRASAVRPRRSGLREPAVCPEGSSITSSGPVGPKSARDGSLSRIR